MNYKELVSKHGNGLMTRSQYEEIAKQLEPYCPCNLLVFGLGEDSYLWRNLNINGLTIFLENDKDWISKFLNEENEECSYFIFSETEKQNNNLKIHHIEYKTNVQDYDLIKFDEKKIKIDLPTEVTQVLWDFIIVDAPLGHQPPRPYKGPGRMSSIFSASSLIKEDGIVVIDDFNRDVERIYSKHYFGEENLFKVVEGKVAFFKKNKK
jgi:glucuronoxylan 4-O-methyltransferase